VSAAPFVGAIEVPLRIPEQIVVHEQTGKLWMEFVEYAELSRVVDLENISATAEFWGTLKISARVGYAIEVACTIADHAHRK